MPAEVKCPGWFFAFKPGHTDARPAAELSIKDELSAVDVSELVGFPPVASHYQKIDAR